MRITAPLARRECAGEHTEFPAKRIVGTPLRFGNRIKREHDDKCQLQMTGRAAEMHR